MTQVLGAGVHSACSALSYSHYIFREALATCLLPIHYGGNSGASKMAGKLGEST